MASDADRQFHYDVALSFAGEDRKFADELAALLKLRSVRVFYDRYEQAELWGRDLYEHLADVYSNQARFCVIFVSANYARKLWTTHERRNAQARAFRERTEYILPLRLDDTEIPGLPATVGYIDLRQESMETVADLLGQKLAGLSSSNNQPGANQPPTLRTARSIAMPQVSRSFSDLDRDTYLEEAFGIIREYFSEGARQLEKQRPGITARVTSVNANKFVCRVYANGNRTRECKIWIGGPMMSDAISYFDGHAVVDNDSTVNDYLTVADNGQELALQLSGFSVGVWRPPQNMVSAEVAAEYFWRRFTSPLNR